MIAALRDTLGLRVKINTRLVSTKLTIVLVPSPHLCEYDIEMLAAGKAGMISICRAELLPAAELLISKIRYLGRARHCLFMIRE